MIRIRRGSPGMGIGPGGKATSLSTINDAAYPPPPASPWGIPRGDFLRSNPPNPPGGMLGANQDPAPNILWDFTRPQGPLPLPGNPFLILNIKSYNMYICIYLINL
jgi:hypothetical protein